MKHSTATVNTRVKDLETEETLDHRKVVLLEDIQSKMEQVIEGMDSTKTTLQNEMGEFRKEVNERFEMVDFGFKKIQTEMQEMRSELKEDIRQLSTSLSETEKRLSDKLDMVDKKLDSHSHPGKGHLKLV